MEFVLHKDIFNTPFHFKCNTSTRQFEKFYSNCFDDLLVIAKDDKTKKLCNLYGFVFKCFPDEKYRKPFEHLGVSFEKIQWHLSLPLEVYKHEVVNYINYFIEAFNEVDLSYYNNVFLKTEPLFNNFHRAKINNKIFSYLSDLSDNQDKSHLKTFLPYNGFAERVNYTRLQTVTGRLKHISGPRALNLQKKYRDIVESKHGDDGSIWYLDYSSLEPRVLLSLQGKKEIPKDIYSLVADELNLEIPRAAIKTAILSRLYGAGEDSIINSIKNLVDYPETVIEIVDDYFQINTIKLKLQEQFEQNSCKKILNYYDRPIFCADVDPYKLLNYYIQSTAVDVANLGFSNIVNRINMAELSEMISPIFIIHDAIVLDVHNDFEYLIPKICTAGSTNIYKFCGINFFLSAEKVV